MMVFQSVKIVDKPDSPFIISIPNQTIKEYGTHFVLAKT